MSAERPAAIDDGWTGTLYPSLRCDYCGDEVVGSDAPSLDTAKEAHRENCPSRSAATTRPCSYCGDADKPTLPLVTDEELTIFVCEDCDGDA